MAADRQVDTRDRELHRETGLRADRRWAMSDHQALAAVVWRESPVILGDLFDETTGREIFGAVLEQAKYDLIRTDNDVRSKEILLGETHDHCIALLLQWAKADLSTGTEQSRAVCRILAYFEAFLMKMVRRNVSRPCDVDPVANEARLRVCGALETFAGKRLQLQSYVSKACRCAAIDHYRRDPHITVDGERRPVAITLLEPGQEPLRCDGWTGDEFGTVEVRIMLQGGWHLLSHDQQVAVWAFLVHEGSWVRAEADLGIPRQTLQSRFEGAREILRRWFSDDR